MMRWTAAVLLRNALAGQSGWQVILKPIPPQPYRLDVHQDVLDDLLERLSRTRWPDEVPGAGWQYGSSLAFMRRLTA